MTTTRDPIDSEFDADGYDCDGVGPSGGFKDWDDRERERGAQEEEAQEGAFDPHAACAQARDEARRAAADAVTPLARLRAQEDAEEWTRHLRLIEAEARWNADYGEG